jgi:hypothetical protein
MLCYYSTVITRSQLFFEPFANNSLTGNLKPSNRPETLTSLGLVDLILALDAGTTGVRTVAFDDAARVVDRPEKRDTTS